jgi:hypothetical protein
MGLAGARVRSCSLRHALGRRAERMAVLRPGGARGRESRHRRASPERRSGEPRFGTRRLTRCLSRPSSCALSSAAVQVQTHSSPTWPPFPAIAPYSTRVSPSNALTASSQLNDRFEFSRCYGLRTALRLRRLGQRPNTTLTLLSQFLSRSRSRSARADTSKRESRRRPVEATEGVNRAPAAWTVGGDAGRLVQCTAKITHRREVLSVGPARVIIEARRDLIHSRTTPPSLLEPSADSMMVVSLTRHL